MQKLSMFIVLAAASFAVAAQQQKPRSPGSEQQQTSRGQTSQGADTAIDKELLRRERADGAAGGTVPVAPESRQAVGAGAGPHLHHNAPSPQKLPKDEPVEPPK
jgi:hypothetical protein